MAYTNLEKVLLYQSMNIRCPLCGSTNIGYSPEPTQVLNYPYIKADGSEVNFNKAGWINCLHGECQDCGFVILRRLDTLYRIGREKLPNVGKPIKKETPVNPTPPTMNEDSAPANNLPR